VPQPLEWDVVVVGAGPAGLSAGYAAARAGARTVVLDRVAHPRYKTCGGGLVGGSLSVAAERMAVPVKERVHEAVFTLKGRRELVRTTAEPLLSMVRREEFDDALRVVAAGAGARIRTARVRAIEQDADGATAVLSGGERVTGRVLVGADGSAGVTAQHVGVHCSDVDLGLELELAAPPPLRAAWHGRLLIDWGPIPGSYGWVFPKDGLLTAGVIAARGSGADTRAYLDRFLAQTGLLGLERVHDSGHLTRCRAATSPLRRDRVLVAGDAAGLLEPWTREGISYALRSGTLAGEVAGTAPTDAPALAAHLTGYDAGVERTMGAEMAAGRRLREAFTRHPGAFHAALFTAPGWRAFKGFCRGELTFAAALSHRPVRTALRLL
jgi:geranylgeranyl reductase family protein